MKGTHCAHETEPSVGLLCSGLAVRCGRGDSTCLRVSTAGGGRIKTGVAVVLRKLDLRVGTSQSSTVLRTTTRWRETGHVHVELGGWDEGALLIRLCPTNSDLSSDVRVVVAAKAAAAGACGLTVFSASAMTTAQFPDRVLGM